MLGSRGQFLGFAAVALTGRRAEAEDPFDSLPPAVWRNARANGLVRIRRPAQASCHRGRKLPGQTNWANV